MLRNPPSFFTAGHFCLLETVTRSVITQEFWYGRRYKLGEFGRFPFRKNFGKFLLRISVWEERVPFVTSAIRSQVPLCRFTKRPDALVNCSAIFSNTSFFVAYYRLCGYRRSLTSASSHLSRFAVIETSPVNEELPKNFRVVHATFYAGNVHPATKASNKQEFYLPLSMWHIRAAINFLDLAL